MSRRSLKGALLAALSAFAFGWLAIFARAVYDAGSDPVTVLTLRFALAGLLMVAIMAIRRDPLPRGRPLPQLVAMGALGYVGQSLLYFTALTLASTSLVALLLYLYPALVTLMSAVVFKERITATKWAAVGIAFAGTALTIGPELGGQPLGIALGLGAALVYAVYILAGGQVMKTVAAVPATTVILCSAALVYAGLSMWRGMNLPTTLGGWAGIAMIAVFSTVIAAVAFLSSVELIGPSNASLISTVEPAITVALATLLYGEQLTFTRLAGGTLIMVAVVMLARTDMGRAGALPPPE